MDLYELIARDHRKIEALFDACERAGALERPQDFAQLANQVFVHATAEERAFYARLRGMGERVVEARAEHEQIERKIEECRGVVGDGELFLAKLGELRALIARHVEREEGELFAAARRELDGQEAKIAEQFVRLKDAIAGGATNTASPLDDMLPGA